jgi:hypothetical protein
MSGCEDSKGVFFLTRGKMEKLHQRTWGICSEKERCFSGIKELNLNSNVWPFIS